MAIIRFPAGHRACSHCGGSGVEIDPKQFGAALREKRKKAALSLRAVAEHMGIVGPYLSDLERGNRSFNSDLTAKFEAALIALKK